ncbi:glucose-6-phosphate isomerase [Candidatus Bipolaricaulota bacterium]|nr:glucose-6-phosphate isomerase [Candidatus Bipolaricaulota bacterium]
MSNYDVPFGVGVDFETGVMDNPDRVITRRASDMRGYYANPEALEALIASGDPIHYMVYEKAIPERQGHLLFCMSVLQPGRVGNEYFLTKGHYHTEVDTAETYLCVGGRGYLLMKTEDGQWAAEKMEKGRMVYAPPLWAHRSINTGSEPLISFCVYPAHAGHNYGDIQTQGFPRRIMQGEPEPRLVK